VDEPLVSVVIPAFEAEDFLGEAIESVLAQTYSPIELIVVDDGSEDRTAEVAGSYPEVRLLRRANGGQAAARNSGFEASSGEFITFHDADDVMLPRRIELQVEHLRANSGVGAVLGGQELIFEDGAEAPFWMQVADGASAASGERAGRAKAGGVHTVTVLLRREAFEQIGGYDEAMSHGEDVDLLLRLREAWIGVTVLDQPLVRRRIHPAGMTQAPDSERHALVNIFRARIERKRGSQ
jgi:glycosyltransferase involved in cell wall biosynthesis